MTDHHEAEAVLLAELRTDMKYVRAELKDIKEMVRTSNGRIRTLEGFRWLIIGGWSVLTVVVGWMVTILFRWL